MDSPDRSDPHALPTSAYEQLVQTVVDYGIYMLDLDGYVVSWNAGAQRIKGYRADEIIGQHFSRFFTQADRDAGKPAWLIARALSHDGAQDEGWRVRKDGSEFWALIALDVVRSPAGEIIGLAKITRDITDRRNAALQLEAMRAQLFQAQKLEALGQLTGGMAHDFNNLLTIIIGSAKLAMRSSDGARVTRLLEHILDAGERGSQMTQQLLSFARRNTLKAERIDLAELIESLRALLVHALPGNIELSLDIETDLPEIEVDAPQLQMVLLNLVLNARDALENGGLIQLQASRRTLKGEWDNLHGEFVQVCVSDNGHGMEESVLSRIFEPFFTTKGFGKGTGLGLSQVYGFARQSNGCINADSTPGVGTCMSLCLPVWQPPGNQTES